MNNDNQPDIDAEIEQTEVLDDVATTGAILKAAREHKGMSIEAAALSLHLRPKVLVDIEADNFDDIASTTYVRGYIRNYAKLIDADIEAINSCLEHQLPDITAPSMQSFSRKTSRQARDSRLKLVTYLIAIALVAMLILWWVQKTEQLTNIDLSKPTVEEIAAKKSIDMAVTAGNQSEIELTESQAKQIAAEMNEQAIENVEAEAVSPEVAQLPAQVTSQQSQLTQSGSLTHDVSQNTANEVTSAPQVEDNSVIANAATPTVTTVNHESFTQAQISMELSGDCWVNVTDATGRVIIDGVKSPGRVISATGAAPLQVVLGAPQVVSLQIDGSPIDLSSFSSGRVARLTLPNASI
ncbi:RodZ domain-containing protein [Shewanella maritima]|uniref:RodZ domain-containing protein n=1 Tax=Shewanella maritima TaxID=2520507 RepID=UPI003734EA3F